VLIVSRPLLAPQVIGCRNSGVAGIPSALSIPAAVASSRVNLMRFLYFFLLVLLSQSIPAFPASGTCPEVSDYACLVKNSMQVYRENYEQWR